MSETDQEKCDFCGKEIPVDVIARRHYTLLSPPKHIFCNKKCRAAYDKERGRFKDMSVAGKANRSTAVAESNRRNPRRARKP